MPNELVQYTGWIEQTQHCCDYHTLVVGVEAKRKSPKLADKPVGFLLSPELTRLIRNLTSCHLLHITAWLEAAGVHR